MNYKMLVLDLDDSLLGTDLKISHRNREALLQLQEKEYLLLLPQVGCLVLLYLI